MLRIQVEAEAFRQIPIAYHDRIPIALAEAYFAISEAYKRVHLEEGRRTNPIKQAAFTCVAISVIRPLRPVDSPEIDNEELLYVNQMLAMRASCAIIDHPFHKRAFDDQRRFYRSLSTLSLPSLDPLIGEVNNSDGKIISEYDLELSLTEQRELNFVVSMFTVLNDLPIYKKPEGEGG